MELGEAVEALRTEFGFVVGLDLSLTRAYLRCYEPPAPKHCRFAPPDVVAWCDPSEGPVWHIEADHPRRRQILAVLNREARQPDTLRYYY
jgi:hypothetical protein